MSFKNPTNKPTTPLQEITTSYLRPFIKPLVANRKNGSHIRVILEKSVGA